VTDRENGSLPEFTLAKAGAGMTKDAGMTEGRHFSTIPYYFYKSLVIVV